MILPLRPQFPPQGWPAVVINPAVDPARDLAHHIGEQTAFHTPQERFIFRAAKVDREQGSDPALSDFEHPLPLLLRFLHLHD